MKRSMSRAGLALLLLFALPNMGCKPGSEPGPPDARDADGLPSEEGSENSAPPEVASATSESFHRTLELHGITFHVTGGEATVTIDPEGLEIDQPFEWPAEGVVVGAEVADLDADSSPEVYVYLRSGDDARGSLVAVAANNRKSLSQIYLPPLTEEQSEGYAGHDEFAVVESVLARRFPITGDGDDPAETMRQLQYVLEPGEAGWVLRVDQVLEF